MLQLEELLENKVEKKNPAVYEQWWPGLAGFCPCIERWVRCCLFSDFVHYNRFASLQATDAESTAKKVLLSAPSYQSYTS